MKQEILVILENDNIEDIIDGLLEKEDHSNNSSYNINLFYKESTFSIGADADLCLYASNFTEAIRLINLVTKVYRKGVEIGKKRTMNNHGSFFIFLIIILNLYIIFM